MECVSFHIHLHLNACPTSWCLLLKNDWFKPTVVMCSHQILLLLKYQEAIYQMPDHPLTFFPQYLRTLWQYLPNKFTLCKEWWPRRMQIATHNNHQTSFFSFITVVNHIAHIQHVGWIPHHIIFQNVSITWCKYLHQNI